MSKRKIPTAAKGAFDPMKLRLTEDNHLVSMATEIATIVQLEESTIDDQRTEAIMRRQAFMDRYGLKDFAKARKQISQEYSRRYAKLGQERTFGQLREALEEIDFQNREWTPFGRSYIPPLDIDDPKIVADIEHYAKTLPCSYEEAVEHFRSIENEEVWLNSKYQVNVRRTPSDVEGVGPTQIVHLSIKRVDKKPCHDWRDFQRIKDELLGRNCEAVELYPAQRRVVDTANQYHLWGIQSTEYQFPLGFDTRIVDSGPVDPDSVNSKQRPVDDGYHVEDIGIEAEGAEAVRLAEEPSE